MKKIYALILSVFISACSTGGDVVLQRADNLSRKPDWASETVSSFEQNGVAYFIGTMSVDGNSSSSWVCMAASNMAKNNISSLIRQKLDFVTQIAQEGTDIGVNQMKYVGTEASDAIVSGLKRDGCYWEKVLTQNDTSSKRVEYKAFVKMSIPVNRLEQAIRNAAKKQGVSPEFAEQANQRLNETLQRQ